MQIWLWIWQVAVWGSMWWGELWLLVRCSVSSVIQVSHLFKLSLECGAHVNTSTIYCAVLHLFSHCCFYLFVSGIGNLLTGIFNCVIFLMCHNFGCIITFDVMYYPPNRLEKLLKVYLFFCDSSFCSYSISNRHECATCTILSRSQVLSFRLNLALCMQSLKSVRHDGLSSLRCFKMRRVSKCLALGLSTVLNPTPIATKKNGKKSFVKFIFEMCHVPFFTATLDQLLWMNPCPRSWCPELLGDGSASASVE